MSFHRRNYRNLDPHWIDVRWANVCSGCHAEIKEGEKAFYYPNGKRLFCDMPNCGQKASREFVSIAFDDRMNSEGFGCL